MFYEDYAFIVLGVMIVLLTIFFMLQPDPPPPPEPPTYTYEECIRNAEIALHHANQAWSTQLSQYYAQKATAWSELAQAKLEARQHQP